MNLMAQEVEDLSSGYAVLLVNLQCSPFIDEIVGFTEYPLLWYTTHISITLPLSNSELTVQCELANM